jgi:GNAT superfamily N-acetyltransferase
MPTQKTAVPLAASQVKQAAAVMSRAFFEDPFFTFVFPRSERCRRILPWIFERTLSHGLRRGRVLTTSTLEGVALWLGPHKTNLGAWEALLSGLFLMPILLGWRELQNSLRLNRLAAQLHKQTVAGRHWYLVSLGVEPSLQGRGVAGVLLQPVLALADWEALPCYLETNNETNLPFYEHYGFAVAGHVQSRSGDPRTWAMLRKPD